MNTKEKLTELLGLCIEKGLDFHVFSQYSLIEIKKFDDKANRVLDLRAYYDKDENTEGEIMTRFSDLITKVKNYKP